MTARAEKVGVWLVGARGSVATTTMTGAAALAADLAAPDGLVTSLAPFESASLPEISDLVFGGHDLAFVPLVKRAELLADGGVIPRVLVRAVADQLKEMEANLRPGIEPGPGPQIHSVRQVIEDLEAFKLQHALDRIVVVNLASTEPPATAHPAHDDLDELRAALCTDAQVLPMSSLYAYAALESGCSFVDFTPSTGALLPALLTLADEKGAPIAGRDGKTGETLVKAALAPMFAARALKVKSWVGTNLLGSGDGRTLADPDNAESKLASKGRVLNEILGYEVEAPVRIDYVSDLGEWKTAWDYISFEGFLGTRMRMQFVWEGCDSALAAPLILDLVRLTARAHAVGCSGPQAALAFFFKDPVGSNEHRLERQFSDLCGWAGTLTPKA